MVYIIYIWYSKEDIMTNMKIMKTMYSLPWLSHTGFVSIHRLGRMTRDICR